MLYSSPVLLKELAQNLSLPLMLFSSNLQLHFINDVAEKVLDHSYPSNLVRTAEDFFRKDRSADSTSQLPALACSGPLRKQLEKLASECARMTWSKGCQIQIWNGAEGDRTSRWYEASIQTHDFRHAEKYTEGVYAGYQEGASWFSVLLLRALPSSLIPRIFKRSLGSSPGDHRPSSSKSNGVIKGSAPRESSVSPLEELLDPLAKGGLTLSDAEMRAMVENLPDICMIFNATGMATYMNPRWYERAGLSPHQSSDVLTYEKLHHLDDKAERVNAWSYAIRTGTPVEVEYRVRQFDSSWHWVVMRAVPIINDKGEIYQWVATVSDVDELVQARTDALHIQERVKAILDAANVVIISVSRDSIVTFFEGSGDIAVPSDHLIDQPLGNAWPDRELPIMVNKMMTERLGSLTWQQEQALDNGRCFRYRLTPLYHNLDSDPAIGDMDGVIIVATDVTDQVAAEAALKLADEECAQLLASESAAREASRFKTAFVTNISHEIRTPIAAMIGISELVLDDPKLADTHRSLLEKSIRSGELLLDLVGMVLDMGKVEAGKLEIEKKPFHLMEIVSVLDLFAIAAQKKGLRFTEDFNRQDLYPGCLSGDPLRLRQILANFLVNAIKFTIAGSVAFRIRAEERSTPNCLEVTFEVQDTGIGIPDKALKSLFQPFYQADASTARKYGGSGLGLFLSKSFADMMDGHISVNSILGQGTTVSAKIPFQKSGEFQPVTQTSSQLLRAASLGTPLLTSSDLAEEEVKILVADDNDLIREIVQKTLQRMKFNVTTVPGGAEAVAAVQSEHYDLVLMDGQMPGVDGYEATRLIRKLDSNARNIHIIALTASAIRGDKERCLEAGMDGYLTKPIRAVDLKSAIVQALKTKKRSTPP